MAASTREVELGEVAVSVLGEVEGVVRAADGGLEVAQQRVDGLELRQLHAGLSAARDVAFMLEQFHRLGSVGREWAGSGPIRLLA